MKFCAPSISIRWTAFTVILVAAGCVAHLPPGTAGLPTTSPTPTVSGSTPISTPTATASASTPCATAAPDAQQIGITLEIAVPTSTPQPYGLVAGYGIVTQGTIDQTTGAPITLLPTDKVQFVNADTVTGRSLSAAGLASTAIPASGAFPASYAFPATSSAASGTEIDGQGLWSTGLLGSGCYSQEFTLKSTGTFYFGDLNYYSQYLRDVIIVSATAPQAHARRTRIEGAGRPRY